MWVICVEDKLFNKVSVLPLGAKNRAACLPVMEHHINEWAEHIKLEGEGYSLEGCVDCQDHNPGLRLVDADGKSVIELVAYQIEAVVEAQRIDPKELINKLFAAILDEVGERPSKLDDTPPSTKQSIH